MDYQSVDVIQGVAGKGPKRKKTRVIFGFKDFSSRKRLYTFRTSVVAFCYTKLARSVATGKRLKFPVSCNQQVALIFFFSMFRGFFPLINSMFVFSQERPMLIKERSLGMYRLSSYYFARMAGNLPMELVLPTVFTITYCMGGLKPSLLTFSPSLLIVLFNVLVSQGLGLAIGAILMDVKQATTLASVIMFVFLLASGYYIQHSLGFIAWLKYVSFSHCCYKLLVGDQYSATDVYECGSGVTSRVSDFSAIKFLGLGDKGWDVAALAVMLVGYRLLAYVVLRMGQPN